MRLKCVAVKVKCVTWSTKLRCNETKVRYIESNEVLH